MEEQKQNTGRPMKILDVTGNLALEEAYRACLEAFFNKLGWTEEQKTTHPLNAPLNLFYREEEHMCSVNPYADPNDKASQPVCRVDGSTFPAYLETFYQIPQQAETAPEREALYCALEKLILERKRTGAEEIREKMMQDSPGIGMFLTCQEWLPFLYQSEEGNLIVDMGAVQAAQDMYDMQPNLIRERIQSAGEFLVGLGDAELNKLPEGRMREYLEQLRTEGTNRIQQNTFVNCGMQKVCGQERSQLRMLPKCQVFERDQLATLQKVPAGPFTVFFEPNPEQFLEMRYDLEEKRWRTAWHPAFRLEVPVEQADGVAQDRNVPVLHTAMYDRKVMPAGGSRQAPQVSPAIVDFFRTVCGGCAPMIRRLAKFFAAVMAQNRSGLTVLQSQHQTELLRQTLQAVFHDCLVPFGEEEEPARTTEIALDELEEAALGDLFRAQLKGRSLVLVKDALPAHEELIRQLLRGEELTVSYQPKLLAPQRFRNHLHFATVTDCAETGRAFAEKLGAEVLDFTAVEQAETVQLQFSQEDLEWFRAKFLVCGLKLRALGTSGEQGEEAMTPEQDLKAFLETL